MTEMILQKKKAVEKLLSEKEQTHILRYFDELDDAGKLAFLEQIENTDFSVLDNNNADDERGLIEPVDAVSTEDIAKNSDKYRAIGIELLKQEKVGAVLLAGGQGSRLGFEKPKGMFNVGVTRELYIFQCLINNMLDVVKESGTWIPLFIMTSEINNDDTQTFLKEHDFFGYNKDYVWFFVQEQLPTLDDQTGKLMLSAKGCLSTAPNGNGGWYASMAASGMLEIVKKKQIEWLNVFSVDNVLQRIADPCFIGAVVDAGMDAGSKVVSKTGPEEKVGVMCMEDGKPSIIEYYEMSREMLNKREENGRLSFTYGVILNYLFKVEKLDTTLKVKLPLHRAHKAIKYMNENCEVITPEDPNAYKYETLALDMVKLQDSCLTYEVERDKEFAPVKNKKGEDSVDSARELLKKNNVVI